jgi:hypothetical protein
MVCHSRAANFVLGPSTVQMNRDHDYGSVRANQLRTLEHLGVLRMSWAADARESLRRQARDKGLSDKEVNEYVRKQTAARGPVGAGPSALLAKRPERYDRLADPYHPKQDLAARARSYLHANCAQSHVEAGGGNAQFNVEFTAGPEKMNLLDVKPLHHTFGIPDARLVAPGFPERSVLLARMGHRDAGHMPPLATALVDRPAVELIRQWIREMKHP